MQEFNSVEEVFAFIRRQRKLEVRIAKQLMEACPTMRPIQALATAEQITRGE